MGIGMDIVSQLASQIGSRRQDANVKVAARCLSKPDLLGDVAACLTEKNARLAGDCAEVMAKVAEQQPLLVVPYAKILLELLGHKNGRVRWESAHALALLAEHVPRLIADNLEDLGRISRKDGDESVVVRDYVLDAIAGYAATGPTAAASAFPFLLEGVSSWNSKHAARVLRGLQRVAVAAPKLLGEIRVLAAKFEDNSRPGIKKAARSLLKSLASK